MEDSITKWKHAKPTQKDSAAYFLFEDIENMKELKEEVMKGSLKAAVVNPVLIYHMDQLLLATHKCIYSNNLDELKTRSIFTELLYDLSPSRSIRDALKSFGTQDDGSSAILVLFSEGEEKISNGLEKHVQGKAMPLDRISELRDVDAIRKMYKVPQDMTSEETVLNCILSRMASKELMM